MRRGINTEQRNLFFEAAKKFFTYDEVKSLLNKLGFEEFNKGKTSGSRVKFKRNCGKENILLHKPHGVKNLDLAFVKELLRVLKNFGDIKE